MCWLLLKCSYLTVAEKHNSIGSESLGVFRHSGINRADQKHFLMDMHSFVTGYDFTGIFKEAGPL